MSLFWPDQTHAPHLQESVIPAKVGIQCPNLLAISLDSRLRGNDRLSDLTQVSME